MRNILNKIRLLQFRILIVVLCLVLGVSVAFPQSAAAKGINFIRDAEIENTLRVFATPLFLAAGLDPDSIRIHIVNDNSLNAFVAAGQQLFVHSGLLMQTKSAGEVIGVIAHETGHIAGGHLVKAASVRKGVSAATALGYILGGAAVIAGRPDVGTALVVGGATAGFRSYLKFSRAQEASADRAATRFLDRTQQSSQGLLEFMELMSNQELLNSSHQDPYMRTHPITQERISYLRNHIENTRANIKAEPKNFAMMHDRMKVKLQAFMQSPARTLRRYPESDQSMPAVYARSIAYHRKPDLPRALELVERLIDALPNDPYFWELKGQILFESGKVNEARPFMERAVELLPRSALLRIGLARAQIETNTPAMTEAAIGNLDLVLTSNPDYPFAWRQLAIAYGRQKKMGESSRALAEEALLYGRNDAAVAIAERAKKLLKRGSPPWLRAEDIIVAAKENQNAAKQR